MVRSINCVVADGSACREPGRQGPAHDPATRDTDHLHRGDLAGVRVRLPERVDAATAPLLLELAGREAFRDVPVLAHNPGRADTHLERPDRQRNRLARATLR